MKALLVLFSISFGAVFPQKISAFRYTEQTAKNADSVFTVLGFGAGGSATLKFLDTHRGGVLSPGSKAVKDSIQSVIKRKGKVRRIIIRDTGQGLQREYIFAKKKYKLHTKQIQATNVTRITVDVK